MECIRESHENYYLRKVLRVRYLFMDGAEEA